MIINTRTFIRYLSVTIGAFCLLIGCTRYIDTTKVEAMIAEEFPSRTGLNLATVSCPPKEPAKAQATFPCQVTLNAERPEDQQSLKVWVTQQDSDGNIRWDERDGILALKGVIDNDVLAQEITNGILEQTGIKVITDCGGRFRIAKQGDTFFCMTQDGRNNQRDIRVDVADENGRVLWGI